MLSYSGWLLLLEAGCRASSTGDILHARTRHTSRYIHTNTRAQSQVCEQMYIIDKKGGLLLLLFVYSIDMLRSAVQLCDQQQGEEKGRRVARGCHDCRCDGKPFWK